MSFQRALVRGAKGVAVAVRFGVVEVREGGWVVKAVTWCVWVLGDGVSG